ncbi:hypothetical protein CRM22_007698 [Opisthorchis felineus]|uniref:MARVEL domain-containing protein n=1 Tax=Opisthorchis felineus TaxID=147828 RepID=A0A4S2LEZ6_OPIFE|nr:hypothetical protein CRM22_007698 [Opisthorchis felineus]
MTQILHGILFVILSISLTLTLSALATSAWECGNLFTGCQNTKYKSLATAIAAMLLIGSLCFVLLLGMGFVALCNPKVPVSRGFQIPYYIFLTIGISSLLTGVLIYTGEIGRQWSYFLAVCASALAVQVAILAVVGAIAERTMINHRIN